MSLGLEMHYYNASFGFVEAAVKGLSKSFIDQRQYDEFKNCDDMNAFKQVLEETDYRHYINELQGDDLEPNEIKRRLQTKLRDEMEYLLGQAPEPLGTFLEMMLHGYQIDNVVSYIFANKDGNNLRNVSTNPLGQFEGMKSIAALSSEIQDGDVDFVNIFSSILIDLPVGQYFRAFLDQKIL